MEPFNRKKLSTAEKISLFRSLFSGLTEVYGTYDPSTGRSWQEKKPVSDNTVLSHLKGKQPYGIYLLNGDTICTITADFDSHDSFPPIEFLNTAGSYQLPAYIEKSKSKGFHVWIFFTRQGVKAFKARLVVKNILNEIDYPHTEVFPKQDYLQNRKSYGNFINAPLFGGLVPHGKTVFIDPYTLKPYADQWETLKSIERVGEHVLDNIIEVNGLTTTSPQIQTLTENHQRDNINRFGLPPCAHKMLRDGVSHFQRVSCFRLAVHLRRLGIPINIARAALLEWRLKNTPYGCKQVITEREIFDQISWAYSKTYRGFGCNSEAVRPFCHPECPIYLRLLGNGGDHRAK